MSFDHIEFIKANTLCSFGRGSKIILAPVCCAGDALNEHIQLVVRDFERFVKSGLIESTDAYIAVFEDHRAGATLKALSDTTTRLFRAISNSDPADVNCMDQKIDDPAWIFSFAGHGFYPIATAPCYPADSSRYNGGSSATNIMFLPQAAFKRRHQPGKTTLPDASRTRIRQEHEKHGMPYDFSISLGQQECYKIIKPIRYGDAPVCWWETAPGVS